MTVSSNLGRTWTVEVVPVGRADAADLLREYVTEVVSRYYHRPATDAEVDAATDGDPGAGLAPPGGLFLLARLDGGPAGCVGLRLVGPEVAEIKRLYVRPRTRGLGGGALLLGAVERAARDLGASSVRLDTRHDLVEARRLYARHGYVETAPYSDDPYADHWFGKCLA
ncbi:GNAT family N-acetyltransferase [Planosporangium sp. 12N6]|uniref:GNAT family N-acetyltransferase n=1 Tax=Planosporangium spinosum TaxID=3402278 RepID=UPI003CF240BF